MFSEQNSTCGSMCGSSKRKRRNNSSIVKKGWTDFFLSTDTPTTPKDSNTGEHEHYPFYAGKSNRRTSVYDSNGKAFTECSKKAIIVRERNTHIYWWDLTTNYTLPRDDNIYEQK